jgi:hypothetical protein
MARLLPPGALLALEAPDLASLLRDWNGSPERATWLASENYQAFERSRLFLRLREAQEEFAAAAGAPANMALLSDVAGGASALGVYDIGNLELLFVTRLVSGRAIENALWRLRGSYEPREAAGTPFYVRADPGSNRMVAMAVRDDYLILATREDLVANALALIAAPGGSSVSGEEWFIRSVAAAGAHGDVRLVMRLDALARTPQFRSYWIHGNAGELAQYASGVSDLVRTPDGLREERVLLRAEAQPAQDDSTNALGRMLRLVPESAGLYRAWAAPSAAQATTLVLREILAPGPGTGLSDRTAPRAALTNGVTGSAADLESRIDEDVRPPASAGFQSSPLEALLGGAPLTAALHVEATRDAADGVFVDRGSVIVLERADEWPAGAAADALRLVVQPVWARSSGALRWVDARAGNETFSQIDGLERLAVAERGRLLIVASDPVLLASVIARLPRAPLDVTGIHAAGFRHALERERFTRMMTFIDRVTYGDEPYQPPFFSGNLASLSRTLARVTTASIVVRDTGPSVSQTVIYEVQR